MVKKKKKEKTWNPFSGIINKDNPKPLIISEVREDLPQPPKPAK